jgi:hypothetical protein
MVSGCVSIPAESVSTSISAGELTQHVEFLTQPALKGRAAGSWQSAHVRKYLSQRLSQYGCVPWAASPSFELDFKLGKNIVAVLPGSDPELSKEFVLVSAHYDHLKPNWFSYYPGACDNASSVAVLLEIAEKISLQPTRPKRSICFAFFDAEEKGCIGAFAFTCRDDYDNLRIAAVVNLDLLGRDLLDAVENCLIVTGTEYYPALQQHILNACGDHNLKGVPLRADLIDPVGDHVAFASSARPVLFFTCGINKDYHQTTDTIDKINFDKLQREAAAIEQTILALADGRADLLTRSDQPVARQKDDSLFYILDKFKERRDMFHLDPNQISTLDEIIAKARNVDPADMTPDELLDLERTSLKELLGLLKNYSEPLHRYGSAFLQMSELYALDPQTFSDAYRRVIGHYRHNGIPLLKQHAYSDRFMLPVSERNWGLNQLEDGRFVFAFIDTELAVEIRPSLFAGISVDYSVQGGITACRGDLDGIIDLVFFNRTADPNIFEREFYRAAGGGQLRTPAPPTAADELAERKMQMANALLCEIERRFPEEKDNPAVIRITDPAAYAPDPNDSRSLSSPVFLVHTSEERVKQRPMDEKMMVAYVLDSSNAAETRVLLMRQLADSRTRAALGALVDLSDEQTPFKFEDYLIADASYALRFHPFVKRFRSRLNENREKYNNKTLGAIAVDMLKEVTKQDFAADKAAWQKWIKRHSKLH